MSFSTRAPLAFAFSFLLSTAAFAQTPASGPSNGNWGNEAFERQEFREEMQQIRKEHEEIEAATDALIDKCVKTGGAQTEMCQKDKEALKERREKLHARHEALREKMDADRRERERANGPKFVMQHGTVPLSQPGSSSAMPNMPDMSGDNGRPMPMMMDGGKQPMPPPPPVDGRPTMLPPPMNGAPPSAASPPGQ